QRKQSRQDIAKQQQLSEEEMKSLHSRCRLELSEHIEQCIEKLAQHFPGFQTETIYGDRGWGAACSRDDLRIDVPGERSNDFSRLEITIRPFTGSQVIDLAGKATIRNKEAFNRNSFERLQEVDTAEFIRLADTWVVEFAELFSAQ
ncbi:MAG: hypothetical protein VB817_06405, partial [Pirellulaceae bacterium]